MASTRHNARKAAVQALYQWDLTQQRIEEIEGKFEQIHDLQNVDRKYLREIMLEVPTASEELEGTISPFLDRDLTALDPVERAILRLGAYELKFKADRHQPECRRRRRNYLGS